MAPITLLAGTTERVSVASDGTQGNDDSGRESISISADGNKVAFMSRATNLGTVGETYGTDQVFVHNLSTGETHWISRTMDGKPIDATNQDVVISGNGLRIAYVSWSPKIVIGDTNGRGDVFVYDSETGTTRRVSIGNDGSEGNLNSERPSISRVGGLIAFESQATNLVGGNYNLLWDIFLHNTYDGSTTQINVSTSGDQARFGDSHNPSISQYGRYVAYESEASNLVDNDTNGASDIFVRDRRDGTTERVSVNSGGYQALNGHSRNPSISADGRFVAFESRATNLVANDTNLVSDIFIHDRVERTTYRVSVNSREEQASYGHSIRPSISQNGRYVAFESRATNLVDNDTNTASDIFIRDLYRGTTERVSVASDGSQGNWSSIAAAISANGTVVAFESIATTLVSNDTNDDNDVFVHINPPPVAIITGPSGNVECSGASTSISLDGRSSYDPQGETIYYNWTLPNGNSSTAPYISYSLGRGSLDQDSVFSLSVTDPYDQVDAVNRTLVLRDRVAPTIDAGADVTLEATSIFGAPYEVSISSTQYSDSCFEDGDLSVSISPTPPYYELGETIVTVTVTDPNENSGSDTKLITVEDTTPPTLIAPDDITREATAVYSLVWLGTPAVSDIFPWEVNNDAPSQGFPLGSTIVTWTATDSNKNSSQDTQQVTIEDTTPPTITVPPDRTVEATALLTYVNVGMASAYDIFEPVTLDNDVPGEGFPLGATEVTWMATDANGNSSEAIQRITVQDTTAPVITLPPDRTVEATALLTPVNIGLATATDIFGPVSISNNSPVDGFPLGTSEVIWTAVDANGVSGQAVQRITVRDTTPPTLTPPADLTVEATAKLTPVVLGEPTVFDLFLSEVHNDAPVDGFPLGITEVTWVAIDTSGNAMSATQRVTVVDTTPPVLSLPPDLTVEASGPLTVVDIGQAIATDIFDPVSIINNAPSAGYSLGTTEVTWIATDANDNSIQGVQVVTVLDRTPPSFELERVTDQLWPHHHQFVLVAVVSDVFDTVDPSPTVDVHVTVTNDDSHKGRNFDSEDFEWEVRSDGEVWEIWLRANHRDRSDDLVYTISITVSDASGNQSFASHVVTVSHDNRHDEERNETN